VTSTLLVCVLMILIGSAIRWWTLAKTPRTEEIAVSS
jgi:hypothetical protein